MNYHLQATYIDALYVYAYRDFLKTGGEPSLMVNFVLRVDMMRHWALVFARFIYEIFMKVQDGFSGDTSWLGERLCRHCSIHLCSKGLL